MTSRGTVAARWTWPLGLVLALIIGVLAASPATAAPAAPGNLAPKSTTVKANPVLKWSRVRGAASYNVEVSESKAFCSLLLQRTHDEPVGDSDRPAADRQDLVARPGSAPRRAGRQVGHCVVHPRPSCWPRSDRAPSPALCSSSRRTHRSCAGTRSAVQPATRSRSTDRSTTGSRPRRTPPGPHRLSSPTRSTTAPTGGACAPSSGWAHHASRLPLAPTRSALCPSSAQPHPRLQPTGRRSRRWRRSSSTGIPSPAQSPTTSG